MVLSAPFLKSELYCAIPAQEGSLEYS